MKPVHYDTLTPPEKRQVREQYVIEQNGLCYWCHCPLDQQPPKDIQDTYVNLYLFPPNFLKHPIHLQHDHDSGLTEGAVHARCNAIMWQYHGR